VFLARKSSSDACARAHVHRGFRCVRFVYPCSCGRLGSCRQYRYSATCFLCTNVNMNISTGNSSHRTLARPETLGCHIGTRQNIPPDFMYEFDKRLASASMFVRLLFFPSRGIPIGISVIMSIADSRSSNSSHPRPMAVLRSHNMLCKYASTSNLTW
jgi:hypothetical protein